MTKEQIEKAKAIVGAMNKVAKAQDHGGVKRYFQDGDIVCFTDCTLFSDNALFGINDNPQWEIWFSQLNKIFIDDNIEDIRCSLIELLDGNCIGIFELDMSEFYDIVRGKKFQVSIDSHVFGAVNRESNVWENFSGNTIMDCLKFVQKCIENDRIMEIRDLVERKFKLYNLLEIR